MKFMTGVLLAFCTFASVAEAGLINVSISPSGVIDELDFGFEEPLLMSVGDEYQMQLDFVLEPPGFISGVSGGFEVGGRTFGITGLGSQVGTSPTTITRSFRTERVSTPGTPYFSGTY
jgi:hypothetical protein